MARDLFDGVYGCLAAGAAGDSLGAPVEGWTWTKIREVHGRMTEHLPFSTGYSRGIPGSVTDDSVYRHYLCWAIVDKGGRVTPEDVKRVWLDKVNTARLWDNEKATYYKLLMGANPWDAGRGNPAAGCATMAMAPIGIINAGNPAQAYQDAMGIASINQEGANRDAAATLAAAVARALVPRASVEDVIEAMMTFSSDLVRRSLVLTLDLASACSSVDEFCERFYEAMLDWRWPQNHWKDRTSFSGDSLEFFPVVPALLLLTQGDLERGLVEGASFGRDCDTISSLVGNLAGAMHGASALREDWRELVEEANSDLFEELTGDPGRGFAWMAGKLVEALEHELAAAVEKTEALRRLVHPG